MLISPKKDPGRHSSNESHASNVVSIDEALNAVGFGSFQYLLFAVCCTAVLVDGIEMLSVALLFFPLQKVWGVSLQEMGLLASLIFFGVMLGSIILGPLSDTWSRRKTMILSLMIVVVGGFLSAFATELWTLALLRMVSGFGMGGVGPSVYSTCTEYFPVAYRGRMLTMISLSWCAGQLIACGIGYVVMADSPETTWRLFIFGCTVPAVFGWLFVAFLFPEVARTMAIAGNEEEVVKALTYAAKLNGVEKSFLQFLGDKKIEMKMTKSKGSLLTLLSSEYRRITLCVWGVWGTQTYIYYGAMFLLPVVVSKLSIPADLNSNIYFSSALSAFIEIPGILMAAFLTDSVIFPTLGRRHMMGLFTLGIMIACILLICASFASSISVIIIAMIVLKFFASGGTALTISFTSEVYPTAERSTGIGAASAVARLGSMTSPLLSSVLVGVSTVLPFVASLIVSLFGLVCVYLINVETRGTCLEDTVEEHVHNEEVSKAEHAPLLRPHVS